MTISVSPELAFRSRRSTAQRGSDMPTEGDIEAVVRFLSRCLQSARSSRNLRAGVVLVVRPFAHELQPSSSQRRDENELENSLVLHATGAAATEPDYGSPFLRAKDAGCGGPHRAPAASVAFF